MFIYSFIMVTASVTFLLLGGHVYKNTIYLRVTIVFTFVSFLISKVAHINSRKSKEHSK